MQIEWVSTGDIKPYENNPRHNKEAVDKVAQSLATYGWQQPIVVDGNQIIIAGHTRWLAAQKLEMSKIPVTVAKDLTPDQVRAYRIADNRLSEEATWDHALLSQELALLKEAEMDLSLTAFDEREITALLGESEEDDTHLQNLLLEEGAIVTQPGDVWELRGHRVMCGDATNAADMEKVMAGQVADLLFTDPPYNVDYTGVRGAELTRRLQNDALSSEEYQNFLTAAFAQAARCLKPEASLYICHASLSQDLVQQALLANQFQVRTQIVWAKNHFVLNRGRYKTQHELIFYAHRRGQADVWYGDNAQTTVWHIDRPLCCDLHPTMKPLGLMERALENSSLPGDRVLDLFGGSGSTLIACEQSHRQAIVMEIAPRYVDVIVRRWQKLTGQAAVLFGDGRTFEACASARASRSLGERGDVGVGSRAHGESASTDL